MSVKCPPDHRHGETHTCYNAHNCRCAACRHTKARKRRYYDWEYRRRRGRDVWIPATGTRRKLQALAVEGYSAQHVADLIGSHYRPLTKIRGGITEMTHLSMAVKVDRVFREFVMTRRTDREGKITRTRALANGWVSALAWDDIDRDRRPKGVAA